MSCTYMGEYLTAAAGQKLLEYVENHATGRNPEQNPTLTGRFPCLKVEVDKGNGDGGEEGKERNGKGKETNLLFIEQT